MTQLISNTAINIHVNNYDIVASVEVMIKPQLIILNLNSLSPADTCTFIEFNGVKYRLLLYHDVYPRTGIGLEQITCTFLEFLLLSVGIF